MSTLEDNAEILSNMGLTRNEAKVYLATVQLGLASASKISKASKVRREEVYRTLPKLERIGLVERVIDKPLKARALHVEEALSILINREQEKANERIMSLKAKKEEFLRKFRTLNEKLILEEKEAEFVLTSEKNVIIGRCKSMIENARKNVDIIEPRSKLSQLLFHCAGSFKKAMRKDVKVRIITELPDDEDMVPATIEKLIPGNLFDLRYVDKLLGHFIAVDNREALLATSTMKPNLGESPYLWTNNPSLIALVQRNFEDLFHTSVKWTAVNYSALEKAKRFTRQLGPTDHAVFVYNSLDTKHDVLFSYIKSALENGEAALYVCSEEDTDQIRLEMERFGIKVVEYERTGALSILYYTNFYIIDRKFSIKKTQNLWNKLYKEALAKGFKGLRVTGETACFFKHNLIKELVEYEKALHTVLDIPMTAICVYNSEMLARATSPINLYTELVKAHGTVLFEGIESRLGRIKMPKV